MSADSDLRDQQPPPSTPADAEHGPARHASADTRGLADLAEELRAALDRGAGRIDPAVEAQARHALTVIAERLDLGVDHTLVALLGGTGSGKSSLFNAISGLDLADVGSTRPTTSEVTACVWGTGAGPLLDWLGVAFDRQIERESALDAQEQADLRGLVLLDLPDHDSVAPEHRQTVDRLLPMVDLMIWVVDPQKYADDALHSRYLRAMAGHEDAMLVLLNQIDTVPQGAVETLVADVRRLLAEDGLGDVVVGPISARTGEGLDLIRQGLVEIVGRRSVAAERIGAELIDVARLVAAEVDDAVAGPEDFPIEPVVDAVARAAGLPAIADAVASVVRGGSRQVPPLGGVQPDTVELARRSWLATVAGGLPAGWGGAVEQVMASTATIRQRADDALAAVSLRATRSRPATVLQWLAVVLGAVTVVAAVLLALRPEWREPAAIGAVAGAAVLAVALLLASRGTRNLAARRRAVAVTTAGREALATVVREAWGEPTETVLADHRALAATCASVLTRLGAPARPEARAA